MKMNLNLGIVRISLLALLTATACKQAGYQVLQPDSGGPQLFNGPSTIPPTARIETLDKGVSVTWTFVGNKVTVRPTADTLDADYLDKSTCENPGIIHAGYDLGNGQKLDKDRTNCDSLAANEVSFSSPGDYLIQMEVKSQDNEVAWASMTLRVLDPKTPKDQIEGGFTIHAKPLLAQVNQSIQFTAICELKGSLTIEWDFADSTTVDGAVVQHSYTKAGQYRVNAICKNSAGKSLQASLTIVVIDSVAPKLPEVEIPVPSKNPNTPTKTGCDPTQGPCQTGAQMPTGGKTVPQSTAKVWVYVPSCACYVKSN